MTPEELKARLLAEAEAIINEIVDQDEAHQPRTLKEIEQAALKAGLVNNAPHMVAGDSCPECGGKLKGKGKRSKWVLTQAGEVPVALCEQCKTGFFPP